MTDIATEPGTVAADGWVTRNPALGTCRPRCEIRRLDAMDITRADDIVVSVKEVTF